MSLATLRSVLEVEEWVLAAACRGQQDLFFAPDVAETRVERRRREAAAKLICSGCQVRTECLTEALASRERFGIWGGLTERERRALLRRSGNGSPLQDAAGPGRPLSLPAVVAQGRRLLVGD